MSLRIFAKINSINHEKHELIFKNDDDHETFYETYNYEPDEQSKDVQDKSIGAVCNTLGQQWLAKITGDIGIKNVVY